MELKFYEDDLPEDYPVLEMLPYSQVVFGWRMFPELPGAETVNPSPVFGGGKPERPKPEWIRGFCPDCGGSLVSNTYYTKPQGYRIFYECWESLDSTPTCSYRMLL